MIKEIKCSECNEIIGLLEKEVIIEQDSIEYQQMVECSQGHRLILLEEQPE